MHLTTIVIVLFLIILMCSDCVSPKDRGAINNFTFGGAVRESRSDKIPDYHQGLYNHHSDYNDPIVHNLYPDSSSYHPYKQDKIYFPDDNFGEPSVKERLFKSSKTSFIPLDLIRKFNNFSEINDLLVNLVEGNTQDEAPVLEDRFSVGERSAAIVPKSAACMPELQTVKIAPNDDPSILYVPSCTRLERCGGCCSHSLLSCQPTDLETVSFQVVKTQFVGGSKLKFMGKEVVLVDRHTKCKCDCKVQEKDCNKYQEYRKSECRCACTNIDEEKKCYKENTTKLWNPEICACECRNILQCSTGYTFDTLRCRCMPVYIRRRYAEMTENDQEKTRYQIETLPVVPLLEAENIKDNL